VWALQPSLLYPRASPDKKQTQIIELAISPKLLVKGFLCSVTALAIRSSFRSSQELSLPTSIHLLHYRILIPAI
jgi:hypothetical protein